MAKFNTMKGKQKEAGGKGSQISAKPIEKVDTRKVGA